MYHWTSEFVSSGHSDKVADQIADSILDAYIEQDPMARVACEILIMKDLIVVGGEIGSDARVDVEAVVRNCVCGLGYDRPEHSYDGSTVQVLNKLSMQSAEIARAVCKEGGEIGAGDQGVMFGYATNETPTLMPLAHELAREVITRVEGDIFMGRENGGWSSPFLPDAKSQVTVRHREDREPDAIDTIVVSVLHRPTTDLKELRREIEKRVLEPMKKEHDELFGPDTTFVINPSGAWHIGGPTADTGLTGRKTVIDSYGADCPIGGGSFSGKDPTKVDRSAAYVARCVAKNVVETGMAERATVQLSYAIGISEPVSFRVMTHGTGKYGNDPDLTKYLRERLELTPKSIINLFDLRRPIYRKTASGGHFGRAGFPWEEIDLKLS